MVPGTGTCTPLCHSSSIGHSKRKSASSLNLSLFRPLLSSVVFSSSSMSFATRLGKAALHSKPPRGLARVRSVLASRTFISGPVTAQAAGGPQLKQLATANPYKDVVRYEHKNRKWNLQHVDYYSEGLAIGLLETGLQPGDVVLSWLPPHFSESVSSWRSEEVLMKQSWTT